MSRSIPSQRLNWKFLCGHNAEDEDEDDDESHGEREIIFRPKTTNDTDEDRKTSHTSDGNPASDVCYGLEHQFSMPQRTTETSQRQTDADIKCI